MNFLNDYFNNIVKYDLINKFQYKKINIIPKIKTVILKFKCKTNDFKELITVFSFLEFITTRNGMITIPKKPNIVLKIKKNVPIGCKVFLKKKLIFLFFLNTICKKFLETKNSKKFKHKKNFSFISFELKNNLTFLELQTNYFLFNKLLFTQNSLF